MRHALSVAGLSLLLSASASAQWTLGLEVGALIDDNAFNNALQIKDRLTEVVFQAGHDWETESGNTQLLYTGTLDYFSLLPARSFQLHSAGLNYAHLSGEEDETLVNLGGSFALRRDHAEFNIYDYSLGTASGGVRTYLSDILLLKGGYTFSLASFPNLREFDYLEHLLVLQGALSLPSRTTIIVEGNLGFKDYTTANADTAGSTGTMGGQYGRGGGVAEADAPGVTQFTGAIRLGQGITEWTGVSLTGQVQVNLRKDARYLTIEGGVLTDDELFDDHYGYEGPMASLMLTQILPAEFRLRGTGAFQERRYSNRPAFDMAYVQVADQRIDRRTTARLELEKGFASLGLQLSFAFEHIVNASNDVFYTYRNDAISFRLGYTF